ncbi:MAG: carotenoid 1,2-hydratase [Beijerinckiaceae bacterium]|nr:carotenoid 1,2-hydratase [Beijerinckiaceae bacterium]
MRPVARNGYAWWYVDALSDDGAYGLTIIAFIGSVFSPYYAWARRRGRGDPFNHCTFNVALYGRDKRRWAMTERRLGSLQRTRDSIGIGRSAMKWDEADGLTIIVNERSTPWARPVRGSIKLKPEAIFNTAYRLDAAGKHLWRPIGPRSRVEVSLDAPDLNWAGHGYFDSNFGDEPLEAAFSTWDWSRTTYPDHTSVLYDSRDPAGGESRMSLRFRLDGTVETFDAARKVDLPKAFWRMPRATRAEHEGRVEVVQTLEDSPFYARSVLRRATPAGDVTGVHESLSMPRFTLPIVQAMLPFRMPRVLG